MTGLQGRGEFMVLSGGCMVNREVYQKLSPFSGLIFSFSITLISEHS